MKRALSGTCVAIAVLATASGAWASTYHPNKPGDHAPNGCTRKDCTLREAVIKANGHLGPDRIRLRSGEVYHRSNAGTADDASADGDLDILGPLRIDTPKFVRRHGERRRARAATIDADDNERVLDAYAALTLVRVRMQDGLETQNAQQGGGIRTNDGDLHVKRSKLVSNSAPFGGGVIADNFDDRTTFSRSSITNNTVTADGAGIYVDGTSVVSLQRSTVAGNRATFEAGGVYIEGTLKVNRSTVSGNRAQDGDAGAIYVENGGNPDRRGLIAVNSTLALNGATGNGGAVYVSPASEATLNAVTVARNRANTNGAGGEEGGGIYNSTGTVMVDNTIIALNTVGPPSGEPDCSGSFVSGGHNLIGNALGCVGFTQPGDLVGGPLRLGQLADNGGPTKTIALRKGSRAINKAGADAPNLDQRGVKAFKGRDIGAFERRP
jgi:trimeric autotransporter adhesin